MSDNKNENKYQSRKKSVTFDKTANASSDGFLRLITLKILFIDLPISIGDVGTDFAQSYELFKQEELRIYGFLTFAINFMPGLVAAMHVVSVKRDDYGVKKTLFWAGNFISRLPLRDC